MSSAVLSLMTGAPPVNMRGMPSQQLTDSSSVVCGKWRRGDGLSWEHRPMEETAPHFLTEHDGQELIRLLNEATMIMHRTLICDLHLHYHEDDSTPKDTGWNVTLTVKGFIGD